MIYESIRLGGDDRNAESLGAYVAWLVINHLLDDVLERSAGAGVTRVRLHDLTGAGFLTTVLHGELQSTHLNAAGRAFTEHYLVSGKYRAEYAGCGYRGEDEWLRFAEVSPLIARAFKQFREPAPPRGSRLAKIIQFPSRFRKTS